MSQEEPRPDSLKFIQENLKSQFTEEKAAQLFSQYCVDNKDNNGRLEPPDMRKLLFDILQAAKWPLVVPDESLDTVLSELCLNELGAVTWIEFKSFFVFLQDYPLLKLLEISTQIFNREQLDNARLVTFQPVGSSSVPPAENDNTISYDRNAFKTCIAELMPDAGPIFVYFLGDGSVLSLVIGSFKEPLKEKYSTQELHINNQSYIGEIRAFDKNIDVFPPIYRSGGIKSKIARQLADSYVTARKWDETHLKIKEKTDKVIKKVEEKIKDIDDKYKVHDKINSLTQSAVDTTKKFDEKYQISKKFTDSAKSFNDRYKITEKLQSVSNKIKSNEKFQNIQNRVTEYVENAKKSIEDVSKETKQLVQEKQQIEVKDNNEHAIQQLPASQQPQQPQQPQQYRPYPEQGEFENELNTLSINQQQPGQLQPGQQQLYYQQPLPQQQSQQQSYNDFNSNYDHELNSYHDDEHNYGIDQPYMDIHDSSNIFDINNNNNNNNNTNNTPSSNIPNNN